MIQTKRSAQGLEVARLTVLFLMLSLALSNNCFAALYVWTDKNGTTHLSDNVGDVPPEYRDTYRITTSPSLSDSTETKRPIVIPFERTSDGLIVVTVVLNERVKAKMVLDTGANMVVVTEELYKRMNQELSSGGE